MTTLTTKHCACGQPMRDELFTVRCDACQDALIQEDHAATQAQRKAARILEWNDKLNFFNVQSLADEQHIWLTKLDEPIRSKANEWIAQYMPQLTAGLGLVGEPGIGKTTAAAHCLKAAHMHGHSVAITSDPRLHTLAEEMNSRDELGNAARREYHLLNRAQVLMLDDLGQACTSGPGRTLLLKLINERTLAGRRTLWTAQGGGNWLALRLGCPPDPEKPGKILLTEEVMMFLRRLAWPYCRLHVIPTSPAQPPA